MMIQGNTAQGGRAPAVVRPIQHLDPVRLSTRQLTYLRRRRLADVVLASIGLVVAAVPMAVVSAGVLVTMGRPVLFTQERRTQDGRAVRLQKFRSMRAVAPDGSDSDAARLVPFGRFLRASSLDELPSLWNIVRGDMSLVGPRPLTADYLGRFSAEQFARHAVPAGLTGYAQVNGRNALGWDDRLSLDREYVGRFGPALDLRILRDTVATVVRRDGVTDDSGVSMSDFPGPQSTIRLEMEGPDSEGDWVCRNREGATLLQGGSELRDGGVAVLTLHLGPGQSGEDAPLLDEAILLLVSRLRARSDVEWGGFLESRDLPEALAEALTRAGFVAPSAAVRFPTQELPPAEVSEEPVALIAHLGLPDEGEVHHRPTTPDHR